MTSTLRTLLIVVTAISLCHSSLAAKIRKEPKWDAGDLEVLENKTDEFVAALLNCRDLVSLNIAVVKGNKTLLTKGYGTADLTTGRPVTKTTLFGVASLSKAFAATLLGQVLHDHRYKHWLKLQCICKRNTLCF